MKDPLKYRFIFLALLGVFFSNTCFQDLNAQNAKKNKLRISAQYVKIMDGESYFDIKTTSRIDKKNTNVSDAEIVFYSELEDDRIELGKTITNNKGKSKFVLKDKNLLKSDSTNTYNILLSFKGNELYTKASKRISFRNADIKAKLITKDSVNYITAILIDVSKDSLISDEALTVQVQRLFQPLLIGEEFNITDESGTIIVPVEEGIPGVDGNIMIEIVLNESDTYGTVKALVNAPVGTPIVDESTFDERKMWSPRSKTPIFLLVFPNLLIFGIWGFIIYLIINLFKISKVKI
ncbi:MAG: hypothetical protein DRI70_05225 [Bacteroidetes bacterium]|nr:MAG: hypothetical protein DRI70_05225 [Bacteroidota bacterium]